MGLIDFILGMAKSSQNTGKKNTLSDLADALSKSDYRTTRGGKYSSKPSVGTGKVLSSTYKKLERTNPQKAKEVAENFVGKNGKPAWDK